MAFTHSQFRRITKLAIGAGIFLAVRYYIQSSRRISLRGRTVLITGGSRGLGLALARELVICDANVVACARDQHELEAAQVAIRQLGHDLKTVICDLSHPDQAARLISQVESEFGPVDVVINNAGAIIVGPAQTMTLKDFQRAMDLNFWAAVHTTLAAAPIMKSRGFGRIVNIGSVGGKMPIPHLAPYTASKFALVGFSGAMRAELAKDRILITNVNPGLTRTGSPRNATFKGSHEAEYAWFSISDELPGISMSAATAARQIIRALVNGDAEVTLTAPAKLSAVLYGIMPGVFIELAALINRLLPGSLATGSVAKSGSESESWFTRSFLRWRRRAIEQKYNQV